MIKSVCSCVAVCLRDKECERGDRTEAERDRRIYVKERECDKMHCQSTV